MEFPPSETPKRSYDTMGVVDDFLTTHNCQISVKNG